MKKISYATEKRGGEMLKLISQTQKKVKKGKSVVGIMEELEETVDMVELTYNVMTVYPERTKRAIYRRVNNQEMNFIF